MQMLTSKERKARKEHRCSLCSEIIRKGEVYDWTKTIHEGIIYDWKSHKRCSFLCQQLWDYADPDKGMDEELFQDSLHYFCQEFICPDCDKWDCECKCCDDDLEYCIDKAYDLLQTYTLFQTRRSWCGVDWGLVPRTAEERKAMREKNE